MLMAAGPRTTSDEAQSRAVDSDRALVERCLEGDEQAWEQLIHRYRRLVYSIPHRLGLDEEACSDVFQDVFSIVLKQLPTLKDQESLAKWLITLTRRVSWRIIQSMRRHGQVGQLAMEMETETAVSQVVQWERQHLIRTALERLGGRCQELLTLLFLQHDTPNYVEIGRSLDMPVGSIGPTRARCLQKMLAILKHSSQDL
jgi:RNA polymerase sigma factor (sigma-70 family)